MKIKLFFIKSFAFVLLSCLTFSSCKKCGQSVGEPSEKTVQLNPFSSIRGHGKLSLNLIQDTSFTAVIKSEEGLIDNVSFEIVNDTLNIYNDNKCEAFRNYEGSVEITLGVPSLKSMLFTSPTQLKTLDTLVGRHLYLYAYECEANGELLLNYDITYLRMRSGTSTLKVSGKSDMLWVNEQAYSKIDAFNMISDSVVVYFNSTSLVQVNPQNYFKVYLGGSGVLEYKGSPTVMEVEKLVESFSTLRKVD
ncbi:MAG: GIN domain-containing protein [Salibacteraceae bacterium]